MPATRRTHPRPHLLTALAAAGLLTACNSGKSQADVTGVPESQSPAFLGDLVWCDLNCDGIRDPGEPGIPQVAVRLLDGESVIAEAVTDVDGIYQLSASIKSGRYEVEVDQATVPNGLAPPAPVVGGNARKAIDAPPRAEGDLVLTDIDFGFCPIPNSGVIGDFVWHDLDCDGIQDPGEPGIDNVTVVLKDAAGVELDRVTTGQNGVGVSGSYQFTGLALATTYMVEVDVTTLPANFVPAPCLQGNNPVFDSDCSPTMVDLVHSNLTIDFGFCATLAEIGDFVWLDGDGDGIQDASELDDGIDGVTVWLKNASGQIIRTTTTQTTARAGSYRFTGLTAGAYTVELDPATLPPGFVASPCEVGGDRSVDNNCSPAQVYLPTNETVDRTIDFGFASQQLASIGNFVWHDLDQDGLQDQNEPGLPNIRVVLRQFGIQIRVEWTDSAGRYEFTALPAGSYTVEIDSNSLPNLFVASPCEVGNDRAIDSNCSPSTVTLTGAQVDDTIDFGFYSLVGGSIGNFVWDDLNCNGLQDNNEVGIQHVRVLLKDNSGQVIAQQNTDSNGFYNFAGLVAGSYTVEIDPSTLPAGYVEALCQVGTNRAIDNNCSPAPVTLATHTSTDDTIDFGFHHPPCASIGDYVWFDEDCDGRQDWWESGLGGVTLILKDSNGTVLATQVSGNDGYYCFDGLCAGTYTVEFDPTTVPGNRAPTICNVGNNRAIDSNCSPATVVLATNTATDDTIDFGFIPH